MLYETILSDEVEPKIGTGITYLEDLNKLGNEYFGSKFTGVFPADQIPKLSARKPYAIINLDKSGQPGSHWIALAYSKRRISGARIMVYDSFGRPTKTILPSLKGKFIDTEYDAEQGLKEENCGARSLAWLLLFDLFGPKVAIKI